MPKLIVWKKTLVWISNVLGFLKKIFEHDRKKHYIYKERLRQALGERRQNSGL